MILPTGIWEQEEADEAHIFSYEVAKWIGKHLDKEQNIFDK